jgi:hypothetical protein
MTITYPDGTVLQAIVLSREEHEVRAIAPDCDDVLAFTRIHGAWISEELEPVTLEFGYLRGEAPPVFSEDDYICPKELATRLIETLLGACERDESAANGFYVFSPEGSSVAIHRSELQQGRERKTRTSKVV